MKSTSANQKKQVTAERLAISNFIKQLGSMTNRDSLSYLKQTYPTLYNQLEDRLIEAVLTLPDVTYQEE